MTEEEKNYSKIIAEFRRNGYEITTDGVVFSKNGKIMKSGLGTSGYKYINAYFDGKQKPLLIHRLIALAFIPNPETKQWKPFLKEVKE